VKSVPKQIVNHVVKLARRRGANKQDVGKRTVVQPTLRKVLEGGHPEAWFRRDCKNWKGGPSARPREALGEWVIRPFLIADLDP
jgi:hypothetical protein